MFAAEGTGKTAINCGRFENLVSVRAAGAMKRRVSALPVTGHKILRREKYLDWFKILRCA